MPLFHLHFSDVDTSPDDLGFEADSLEQVYLQVCAAIPSLARDLLAKGQDPLDGSVIICDARGRQLMHVPFDEVLPPSQWRRKKARRRPQEGPRSARARNDLALSSFRQMFGMANAGCVLLTPEMHVLEMNEYGARHSHVDREAIRGASIYDIFSELKGAPKDDFTKFMSLAAAGAVSQVIDLPYLVLGADGQSKVGWWNARTWPIFDDDHHLLGFVEWAEPNEEATQGGRTKVEVVGMPT